MTTPTEDILTSEDLVTTGIWRDTGDGKTIKDFEITTPDGTTYVAARNGNKFNCRGFTGTLKAIKERILEGGFNHSAVDPLLDDMENGPGSTWDCVDPCAWICRLPFAIPEEAVRTLDCYGWLDESGMPDIEKADREIARYERMKKEQEANDDEE